MSHMPPLEFYLRLLGIITAGAVGITIILATGLPRKGK